MKKWLLSVFLACVFLFACEKGDDGDDGCDCQKEESCRSGAVCNDGTTSNATGAGACSSHGGVDYWTCD